MWSIIFRSCIFSAPMGWGQKIEHLLSYLHGSTKVHVLLMLLAVTCEQPAVDLLSLGAESTL